MIGTILENLYGITLVIYVGTELGSLYVSLDGSNGGKIEVLLLGRSLGSTDGIVPGSEKGVKLRLFDGKVFSTILRNLDGIKLGFDYGTDMGSVY